MQQKIYPATFAFIFFLYQVVQAFMLLRALTICVCIYVCLESAEDTKHPVDVELNYDRHTLQLFPDRDHLDRQQKDDADTGVRS